MNCCCTSRACWPDTATTWAAPSFEAEMATTFLIYSFFDSSNQMKDLPIMTKADMERIRYLVFPLDCLGLCRLCPRPSDSVSVIVWLSLQLDTNQQQKPFVSALDIWNTRAQTLSLTMAFNPLIPFPAITIYQWLMMKSIVRSASLKVLIVKMINSIKSCRIAKV